MEGFMRQATEGNDRKRVRGIELEGWTIRRESGGFMPVDITNHLPKLSQANGVPLSGNIFRESGIGSIELAGNPSDQLEQAVDNVLNLHRLTTEHGLSVMFRNKSPYPEYIHAAATLETPKSRFKAIVDASKAEVARIGSDPEDWRALLLQNLYAATHVHMSFDGLAVRGDFVAEEMIFANDVLNLIGPRVAKVICRKYCFDNTGHLGIFSKWAAPERFSSYGQWFGSFDGLCRKMNAITRFIHCVDGDKENGTWAPDLMTPMVWGDHDVAELGIWHFSRLRTRQGTIEVRILPSVPIECLADVVRDIDELVAFLVSIAPSTPRFDSPQTFMASDLWREVEKFRLGGQLDWLPVVYTREMWMHDVNH